MKMVVSLLASEDISEKFKIVRDMIELNLKFVEIIREKYHINVMIRKNESIISICNMYVKKPYTVFFNYGDHSCRDVDNMHELIGHSQYRIDNTFISGVNLDFYCGKKGIIYQRNLINDSSGNMTAQPSLDDMKTPDIVKGVINDVKDTFGNALRRFSLLIIDPRIMERDIMNRIIYGGRNGYSEMNVLNGTVSKIEVGRLKELLVTFDHRNQKIDDAINLAFKSGFGEVVLVRQDREEDKMLNSLFRSVSLSKALKLMRERKITTSLE